MHKTYLTESGFIGEDSTIIAESGYGWVHIDTKGLDTHGIRKDMYKYLILHGVELSNKTTDYVEL